MPKQFKGLTDNPVDRKKHQPYKVGPEVSNDPDKSKYSFIDIDTDNRATINYFDKSIADYVEVVTTLDPTDALKMTETELDNLAFSLLSGKASKVIQDYQVESIEICQAPLSLDKKFLSS